ncbi:mannitol dehydrogenase family protein [Achromobacter deleyi]|uniref:mannitol dehydrogenase family protein n=1 Tax=Achromobacter deleyi TaxID=1353891 RepID=UPI00149219B7|nr:mannitol dehydrogenase family protein [Achromobacter deleyi]QVQ26312.1 mannitol dehydrogenase family protein [Achromobacter deleyi]UIP21875.1 mannitol dehydrogenase family protein [Achromobacter deleyi]
MRERLNTESLPRLPADVEKPIYDRSRLTPGIVHLGLGAFHRAHQAVVTDQAMQASGDLSWGILGVSLRRPATRDALTPQDGLYTLAVRDAGPNGQDREQLRVVGSVLRVMVAEEDPNAVLERIAYPQTRIVSLTVTEKGYCHEPATGHLRWDDPDILHDLENPHRPRSTIGILVHGLALRRERGLPPVTLLSCDNLRGNGDTLRSLVLSFALRVDVTLADWIDRHCTFPNSMVDRIVPVTLDQDRLRIAERLGVEDAWPVLGEPYLNWVIEDKFAAGRPAWDAQGGATFVSNAAPYERLKLRMVSGPHSTLAYLGAALGLQTMAEAVNTPALRGFVEAMMRLEIAPTLRGIPDVGLEEYRQRFLARIANPALPHPVSQVAMDGSQKIPQRLLDTIRDRLRAGHGIDRLSLAVAAWLHYLGGENEQGGRHEIQDPLAARLARLLSRSEVAARAAAPSQAPQRRAMVLSRFKPVFGELGESAEFVSSLTTHLEMLREHGVIRAVEAAT